MEDNYLIVREYEERIMDSKSSIHKNFIEFKHPNGLYYFALIKGGKVLLRSEGYTSESSRDHGILSVIENYRDKNNYRTESAHGTHFLILLAANNKEIARSYPMKEEIETFIALNRIEENEESFQISEERQSKEIENEETQVLVEEPPKTNPVETIDIVEENLETTYDEVKDEKTTSTFTEEIVLDKPKLISSPLLDSFKSDVKSEVTQTTEPVEEIKNEVSELSLVSENEETEIEEPVSVNSPLIDLDYFDEDKLVNVETTDKPLAEKIETKLGSILAEEEKTTSKSNWKWLLWLLLLALLGASFLWWMLKMDGCQRVKNIIPRESVSLDTLPTNLQTGIEDDNGKLDKASLEAKATWGKTLGGIIAIRLPDGSLINVPENGTEKKLVEYLDAKCGTSEIKKTWFEMDRILFKAGTDKLKEISDEQITLIAKIFKSYPKKKFKIGGYTDNVGDPETNIRLSALRAASAVRAITAKGIDSTRMRYEGYGQEHPICPANDTEECRAKNRRVGIRVDVCE